jgi:transcription termination factor Rho
MDNQYDSMTLVNLRELAKEKGLKNITILKKSELIEAIKNSSAGGGKENRVDAEAKPETVPAARPQAAQLQPGQSQAGQPRGSQRASQYRVSRPQTNQSQAEQPQGSQPRGSQSQYQINQSQAEQPQGSQPRASQSLYQTNQSQAEQPQGNQPRASQYQANQPQINQLQTEQPQGSQPRASQYQTNQPQTEQSQAEQVQAAVREERRPMAATGSSELDQLDSGETKVGILEVLPDGYGFIRCDNYLPGENDVYVSPAQIRRFNLKTGDIVAGNTKIRNQNEKFSALLFVKSVNGFHPAEAQKRKRFEDLTPVFPNDRIHLETPGTGVSMRMVDLISPIGKGQRGMIVSQPKTGKTTLLKQIAKAVTRNHPDMKLIILLIDERPEEVTDIKESIEGRNVEVIYSTFDELPENHKRVSEMVIERAKRLVEHKQDVVILLDSITRLARAYNLTVQPSGRTLSGGLDPTALHMPKKFFGAARNMREGGSLTILATALVDTGSRMDDVVFEEFKGTGNMELVLDRSLSEKRIFPAIDLPRSSTRREDLLLTQPELEATYLMRKALGGLKSEEALERIIDMFLRTKSNAEFIEMIKRTKIVF